jgi:HK97 family phage prohead protease
MKVDFEFLTEKKKNMPFKVKNNTTAFKEVDEENRIIKAVVSTLNYFDYDFDAIAPGAFNRSISDNGAKSEANDKIAHLLHHDMHRPVGKSRVESEEIIDNKKVIYTESFIPDTFDGEDTITKYNVGIYNQHSVGFNYKTLTHIEKGSEAWEKWIKELINPEDAEEVGYGWKVSEVKWWEYSTVVFGANKLTPYLGTKSTKKIDIYDSINQKLTILANKAMRREIKNKKLFEYELLQLKQMIYELLEDSPIKDARKDSSETDALKEVKLSGFSSLIKTI